jgi:Trk-type K+ transport system membrane component
MSNTTKIFAGSGIICGGISFILIYVLLSAINQLNTVVDYQHFIYSAAFGIIMVGFILFLLGCKKDEYKEK